MASPLIWRPVVDFPNYEVSTQGVVRRLVDLQNHKAGSVLAGSVYCGYVRYMLTNASGKKKVSGHRIVARTFHGPPPTPQHQVAHNDGNPSNNSVENIRWATAKDNQADRRLHGTDFRGERHPCAKLSEAEAADIRGSRARGELPSAVARTFGVSKTTVKGIVRGERWAHLDQMP
jgi:hypothetical protein